MILNKPQKLHGVSRSKKHGVNIVVMLSIQDQKTEQKTCSAVLNLTT